MGAPCSPTVEKILCRSLFSKRSHIGNLRRIRKQGKGRSSKRKGNRRCPFLFAHRRGYGVAPAVRRRRIPSLRFSEKLSARKGRTRLRQFECPAGSVQKRSRPSGANTLTQFACPGFPVQKRSRPVRANTLTQFAHPGFPVQEKEPPRQGEHANAVRVPRSAGAEKEPPRQGEHANAVRAPRWVGAENPGNPEKIFPPEKAAKTPVLTLRKRLSERYS